MNIFAIDRDPTWAARRLPDKHVTKMILESCQMLSLVFSDHYWGVGTVAKVNGEPFKTAKGAFKNHPCTKWAAETPQNCAWLIQHACTLCSEFQFRYDHQHKLTMSVFETKKLFHRVSGEIILCYKDVVSFARAMPEDIKYDTTIDDITAYRKYLNTKEWAYYNYLRKPERRPDWLQPITSNNV